MTERDLHNQFIAYLKKHGYEYFRSRMDKPTSMKCGDPDFVVVKNGRAAFVEFKMPKGKTSPAQDKRFAELAACGCHVLVCRDLEAAVAHVEQEFALQEWSVNLAHLDCIGTAGGKAAVETLASRGLTAAQPLAVQARPIADTAGQSDSGPCFGYPEGSFQPKPELFLASSRDLGQVVVRAGADGGMVYVRLATGLDQVSLGPWTGRI